MRFELRLQNGSKLFPIGMGWHQIIGEVGTATVRECPGFCRDADLADCFAPHAKAGWSFWRLGDAARKEPLDRACLSAPPTLSDAAQGAGFISIEHRSNQQREVRVDVCLSVVPAGKEGASIFDEWSRIVAEAKHDLNREVFAAQFCRGRLSRFRPGRVQRRQNVWARPISSWKSARAPFSSLTMTGFHIAARPQPRSAI